MNGTSVSSHPDTRPLISLPHYFLSQNLSLTPVERATTTTHPTPATTALFTPALIMARGMNASVSLARAMLILSSCLVFGTLIGLLPRSSGGANLRSEGNHVSSATLCSRAAPLRQARVRLALSTAA